MKKPSDDQVPKVEPCDICGDVGFPELIVTCSKCNVNREHMYCMRIVLYETPDYWLCEQCESTNGSTSQREVKQNFSLQDSKKKYLARRERKVQFIPEAEVIKLVSFDSAPATSRKALPTRRPFPGNSSSLMTSKSDHVASRSLIPKVPSRAQKSPMTDHRVSTSKGAAREYRLMFERRVSAAAAAECNSQNISENFVHDRKYLPSSILAWSGQFQILQEAATGEFYDGFEAKPPGIVHRKAYNFSKQMPSVLQMEKLPTLNVLTDTFQNDSPTIRDIALYFFPSDNNGRSRENFKNVFKFMSAENYMLRSVFNEVELLIFTSNELSHDSRGTTDAVNEGYFLWGTFRENETDIDMDIDMMGGIDVAGRIDHVVNDNLRSSSQLLLEGSALQIQSGTNETAEENALISSEDLSPKIKSEPSSEPSSWSPVRKYREMISMLGAPPGFEHLTQKIKSEYSSDPSSWIPVEKYREMMSMLGPPPGFEAHDVAGSTSQSQLLLEEPPLQIQSGIYETAEENTLISSEDLRSPSQSQLPMEEPPLQIQSNISDTIPLRRARRNIQRPKWLDEYEVE